MTKEEFVNNLLNIGFCDEQRDDCISLKYRNIQFFSKSFSHLLVKDSKESINDKYYVMMFTDNTSKVARSINSLGLNWTKEFKTLNDIISALSYMGYPEFLLKIRFNKLSKI